MTKPLGRMMGETQLADGFESESTNLARRKRTTTGLIDIGSNSIRLVIYRSGGRLPRPQFNEREVCRLVKGVTETGNFAEDQVEHALATLRRFARVTALSNIDFLEAFATEAVRQAKNSAEFIKEAESILGVPVKVITGEEEAYFSACGVMSGFRHVDGVVADLGGGSLELAHLKKGQSPSEAPKTSLSCGHLVQASAKEITSMLDNVAWLDQVADGGRLYVVGGAWRSIAAAYSHSRKPRIDIVHGLSLNRDQMDDMLALIDKKKGEVEGISPNRRPSMPQVMVITQALLLRFKPSVVIFSGYGVREGVLYRHLGIPWLGIDPLMKGVLEYGDTVSRFEGLGGILERLILPFLDHWPEEMKRLALASAYLADIAWLEHPGHRARLALEKMLGVAVAGIDHKERVWMAIALFISYSGLMPKRKQILEMLSAEEKIQARFIGILLRFFMTISGGITMLLDEIETTRMDDGVQIALDFDAVGGRKAALFKRRLAEITKLYPGKISVAEKD